MLTFVIDVLSCSSLFHFVAVENYYISRLKMVRVSIFVFHFYSPLFRLQTLNNNKTRLTAIAAGLSQSKYYDHSVMSLFHSHTPEVQLVVGVETMQFMR